MQTLDGGPRGPNGHDHPEVDTALSRERSHADRNLREERALFDSSFNPADVARERSAPRAIQELRDRIRRQRERFDLTSRRDRAETDGVREEENHVRAGFEDRVGQVLSALSSQRAARELADQHAASEGIDSAQCLWLVLAELDVITTAVTAIRLSSLGQLQEQELLALASEVELATDRVLELVGDVLDPSDNRGRYHETGGSG
ncbi:MAG: hypothetical protein IT384_34585 [Deltaproteobacteria bacterium]|nr:hypothetical protein [Deltaproteobacteria bacterium]